MLLGLRVHLISRFGAFTTITQIPSIPNWTLTPIFILVEECTNNVPSFPSVAAKNRHNDETVTYYKE